MFKKPKKRIATVKKTGGISKNRLSSNDEQVGELSFDFQRLRF